MIKINTKDESLKEKLSYLKCNKRYTYFKQNYNSIIPLKIYQTWNTKNLNSKMKERVESLKKQNPKFEHFLFDDNDCREFIKNNFRKEVLDAYDKLIPGAYKADLWRYCILFINGGIYLDIKIDCVNGFKLIELTENEHFVIDRINGAVFNALMSCKKHNPFLLASINQIVENVQNNYYGDSPLHPTGPCLLGNVIMKYKYKLNLDMIHYNYGGYIIYKNIFVISTTYPEYDSDRTSHHYSVLWNNKRIYN
jgi:hypothetical protein